MRPYSIALRFDLGLTQLVVDRVRFVQGTLGECALPQADAYYLYNPFGENLFGRDDVHLGDNVELSEERYERDVELGACLLTNAMAPRWHSRIGACNLTGIAAARTPSPHP